MSQQRSGCWPRGVCLVILQYVHGTSDICHVCDVCDDTGSWAELAALRLLADDYNQNRRATAWELRLMVATSRVAGGATLVADLADVPPNMIRNFQLAPGK